MKRVTCNFCKSIVDYDGCFVSKDFKQSGFSSGTTSNTISGSIYGKKNNRRIGVAQTKTSGRLYYRTVEVYVCPDCADPRYDGVQVFDKSSSNKNKISPARAREIKEHQKANMRMNDEMAAREAYEGLISTRLKRFFNPDDMRASGYILGFVAAYWIISHFI